MFHVKHLCVPLVLPAFRKESRRLYAVAPGCSARCALNAGAGALVVLPLFSAIVYKYPPCLPAVRAHGGLFIASCTNRLGYV